MESKSLYSLTGRFAILETITSLEKNALNYVVVAFVVKLSFSLYFSLRFVVSLPLTLSPSQVLLALAAVADRIVKVRKRDCDGSLPLFKA